MGVLKQWLPYVLSGISAGGQYALIAVGYTMVYGILRLINFAHGDIFMVAGLIMVYLSATMPLYFALPVVVILTVALGFAVERCAYKPLRQAPRMSVMISAIGVSYLLQNVALLIFGANAKAFTSVVSVPALKLADGQINVNYIYSFVIREGKAPVMVFHTDDFEKAESVLKQADVKLVEEEDL